MSQLPNTASKGISRVQVCGRSEGGLLHPVRGPEERGGALPARLLPLSQGQRGPGHHALPTGQTPPPSVLKGTVSRDGFSF